MRKSARTALAVVAASALAAGAVAAPATAAPSKKGTTYVVPAFDVDEVLKPGFFDESKGAGFGIVGNPSKGPIKHVGGVVIDGSGGILEDEDLEIRNFWIDAVAGVASGNVENFGRGDLFELDDVVEGETTITAVLKFTELASLAVAGNDSLEGEYAGSATVELG